MDEENFNSDEADDESQGDGNERTLEEVQAELDKLKNTNENLNVALKEARAKAKEGVSRNKDEGADVNSIVKRTLKIERLENKYNGEDGKPKFDEKELKEYAEEQGLPYNTIDPELVYELKHRAVLGDIEKKEVLRKNKGVVTSDGKAISFETARGKVLNAQTPQEVIEMMSKIGRNNE
jgi:hypothetical protein